MVWEWEVDAKMPINKYIPQSDVTVFFTLVPVIKPDPGSLLKICYESKRSYQSKIIFNCKPSIAALSVDITCPLNILSQSRSSYKDCNTKHSKQENYYCEWTSRGRISIWCYATFWEWWEVNVSKFNAIKIINFQKHIHIISPKNKKIDSVSRGCWWDDARQISDIKFQNTCRMMLYTAQNSHGPSEQIFSSLCLKSFRGCESWS